MVYTASLMSGGGREDHKGLAIVIISVYKIFLPFLSYPFGSEQISLLGEKTLTNCMYIMFPFAASLITETYVDWELLST